jgi:hypothetical protein
MGSLRGSTGLGGPCLSLGGRRIPLPGDGGSAPVPEEEQAARVQRKPRVTREAEKIWDGRMLLPMTRLDRTP